MIVGARTLVLLVLVIVAAVAVGVMLSGYGNCCDLGR